MNKDTKGARNYKGEESEQSKIRRGIKNYPDPFAGEGSTSDRIRKRRLEQKTKIEKAQG